MNSFIEYVETSCKGLKDNHMSYLYKKKVLDEITERANQITKSGLRDEKVLADLIADEYPDIEGGFAAFEKQEKKKRRARLMKVAVPVGSLIYLIIMFITYFSVSSATDAWGKTWLIIVGGIFAWVIYLLSLGIKKLCSLSKIFHIGARILIGGCVMLVMTFVFLFLLMMVPDATVWPVLPLGVGLVLISDLVFAFVTKQKFRTISLMVYMPAIAAMVYIIFAAYGIVSWTGGWIIVLLGVLADLIYIFSVVMSNMKYFAHKGQEVEE